MVIIKSALPINDGGVVSFVQPIQFVLQGELEDGFLDWRSTLNLLLKSLVNSFKNQRNADHYVGTQERRISFVAWLDLGRFVRHGQGARVADRDTVEQGQTLGNQFHDVSQWEIGHVDIAVVNVQHSSEGHHRAHDVSVGQYHTFRASCLYKVQMMYKRNTTVYG